MTEPMETQAESLGWRDRLQARLAGFSAHQIALQDIVTDPFEGSADAGEALLSGVFEFPGAQVRATRGVSVWSVSSPAQAFERGRHSFLWLDDLVALGTVSARDTAKAWTLEWLNRYGRGKGPGWTFVQATRRLARLIDYFHILSQGETGLPEDRLRRALARHRRFVIRRFTAMPPGLARFELCATLIRAGCVLDRSDRLVSAAQATLEHACKDSIGPNGGIATRCPETLATILVHLGRSDDMLRQTDRTPRPQHVGAIDRIAPTVRTLRHDGGSMARFHGGDAGDPMSIDRALAGVRAANASSAARAMGFVRLKRGSTTVVSDCATPAIGRSGNASTLAFEMSSDGQPIIVNCGPGMRFGAEWQRASKTTASHSCLVIDGQSSSRFGGARGTRDMLVSAPSDVQVDPRTDGLSAQVVAAHNGYVEEFGLIHVRRLDLDIDGQCLTGEELLSAVTDVEKRQFSQALQTPSRNRGLPFAIRFHLHPDLNVALDQDIGEATITTPKGARWGFTHTSGCTIRLDPSVYLEKTRAEPCPTQQIVLSGLLARPDMTIKWLLKREE